MPKPHYFARRLPTPEASIFLDELFLSLGLRAQRTPTGFLIEQPPGHPILRAVNHSNGETVLYFSHTYFKEPSNGIA